MSYPDPDDPQDDPLEDRDLPDESDMDDPDTPLIECAHCRRMIHEESEWCHYCGNYVSEEDVPRGKSKWMIFGTVVGLIVVLTWVFLVVIL